MIIEEKATNKLYDYTYVIVFGLLYGLLNEFIAYSEILYDYNKWGGVFELPVLVFIYLLNGVAAYIALFKKLKVGYFLYFDLLLIALSVFTIGCDSIYLLGGWAMFRYGYFGSLLFVIMSYLQRNNILICERDLLLFWIIFGVGVSLVLFIISMLVHNLTVLLLKYIFKNKNQNQHIRNVP